jgi:hypothetical protein
MAIFFGHEWRLCDKHTGYDMVFTTRYELIMDVLKTRKSQKQDFDDHAADEDC